MSHTMREGVVVAVGVFILILIVFGILGYVGYNNWSDMR